MNPSAAEKQYPQKADTSITETIQNPAETQAQGNSCDLATAGVLQNPDNSGQLSDSFLRSECAPLVHLSLEQLSSAVDSCPDLPEHLKTTIKTLLDSVGP